MTSVNKKTNCLTPILEKTGSYRSLMKIHYLFITILVSFISLETKGQALDKQQPSIEKSNTSEMIFRISEIEVYPESLEEYKAILKYEAEASVKLETGVIAIMPMYQKDKPNQFRILEIYVNKKAYEQHLLTPHFKYYKEQTLEMVKSLKLVDMGVLGSEITPLIFTKY